MVRLANQQRGAWAGESLSAAGWYPDPTGRFGRRWHDGDNWTDAVVGANGQTMNDPLHLALAPATPVLQPVAAAHGGGHSTNPTGRPAAPDVLAIIVAGVGVVLVALSLLILDWAETVSFGDMRGVADGAAGLDWPDAVAKFYLRWLGYAWIVLAVVATGVVLTRRAIGRAHRVGHVAAAAVTGLGAVLATFVVVRVLNGFPAEFGAWLLVGGYGLMLTGVVLSARRPA